MAERQNRTVNGQLLTIIESALGPVSTSAATGSPTFLRDLLTSGDSGALRSYVRNLQSETLAALTIALERLSVAESGGSITKTEIYPRAAEFLTPCLPATANVELLGLASVEYNVLAGVESVVQVCAELMNLSSTMRGGLRFAKGTPEFLALRILLIMGAKAFAERFSPALALLLTDPFETRDGSRTEVAPLAERRNLFFPEAFLEYADLPMKHLDNAWSESPHLAPFFESERSYRNSLVGFMFLLTLKSVTAPKGPLYPGYRLIDGSRDAIGALLARLSRDTRFRTATFEAFRESSEEFQARWPERIAAVNGLRLGPGYFDHSEPLSTDLEFR